MLKESFSELLEELDALSDIMVGLGDEREDKMFYGLSLKVDDLIEKYNRVLIGVIDYDDENTPVWTNPIDNEGC